MKLEKGSVIVSCFAMWRTERKYCSIGTFYYIKASGISSGNKLIKTIRYPHM